MNISDTNYSNAVYRYPQKTAGYASDTTNAQNINNPSGFEPKVNQSPGAVDSKTTTSNSENLEPAAENQTNNSQGNTTSQQINGQSLTDSEMRLLEELRQADIEVRQHEMAHIAAGGRYITSGANFSYKRGPDGKNYAVAGEVGIDTAPIPGDPQATLQKMRQVKSSALAPANPSAQDLRVASKAASLATQAMSELMVQQAEEQAKSREGKAFGNLKNAADSYTKVNNLPESGTSNFEIAV